jgi:hypothetical protein
MKKTNFNQADLDPSVRFLETEHKEPDNGTMGITLVRQQLAQNPWYIVSHDINNAWNQYAYSTHRV